MTDEWQNVHDANLLSRADRRTAQTVHELHELVAVVDAHIERRLRIIADQQPGQPGSASYDGIRTGKTVTWCWEHSRDLRECHRDDKLCTGETIPIADPTGEAALANHRNDRAQLEKNLRQMVNVMQSTVSLLANYGPTRAANSKERRAVDLANTPGCDSCARLPGHEPGTRRWEPVHATGTAHGNLATAMPLCAWCYRFVREAGRVPTDAELVAHHEGRKVRRPA